MKIQALKTYTEEETKENFRVLLEEVLHRGYAIDFELKNKQTLLHHAVSLNMEREAVQLLRSGAQIMKNKFSKTPIDIALERGNQIMIQILKRSADYHRYIQTKYSESGFDRMLSTSVDGGEAFGASKYAWTPLLDRNTDVTLWGPCYRLGEVYEDYLDWTDGQRAAYLLRLLESLRVSEAKFQAALDTYSERKDKALHRLRGMDRDLREKEHRYCVKIWGTVEGERRSREELERISQHTQRLKDALDLACRRIFWEGEGQMRYYNGFVIKMWKRVQIRLSGASLHLSYTDLSSQKSRSRVIALEHIEKVEVSNHLVMFPLLRGGRDKDEPQGEGATGARVSSEASGESSSDLRRDKLYFTFYFRVGPRGTSAASPAGFHRAISRGGFDTHSPVSPVPGLTPPPTHPIVVSVDDTVPKCPHGDDTSALLFLAALRSALMPHVTISTPAAVLARELRRQDQPATASVGQDKQHASDYGARRTGGAPSGAAGGEWSDGFSSGLTSVESLLMSSRSSTSTSRTYSFSSCSLPRSSSCSNKAWAGHIDTESPMDPPPGGSGTREGAEHMLSSSLPRSFYGSLNQPSPPSTCVSVSAAGSGPSSTGRGRMTGGTVLGRVVEERDGGERSTSNDSSAHSSSVLSVPLVGGFAGQVFPEEVFADCSLDSSKQAPVHTTTATPQSWRERDSFGSVIMGSSNSHPSAIARSVEDAVQYAQTVLSPPRSTSPSRVSPVSSLGLSLALEEKSPQCSLQTPRPFHEHRSQFQHCSMPGETGVNVVSHDEHCDWKSVCSEGLDGSCPSSPRRVRGEDNDSTVIAPNFDVNAVVKGGLSETVDVSLNIAYNDDAEGGGRASAETLGLVAVPVTDCGEEVIAPSVDLSTQRPSLLSLSLQRQPASTSGGDLSGADYSAAARSPTPGSQNCAPPVTSAAATEASEPLTYSCTSTSYIPSSTAGYGLEFDMGSPTLSPAGRRRPSVPLTPAGESTSPSLASRAVDTETIASPPIKIPAPRGYSHSCADDFAMTLVNRLLEGSEQYACGSNQTAPAAKHLQSPQIDTTMVGPAPAHLYGTPTTSMSYDPMSVHISLSLPEGEKDDELSSLLPPSGNSRLRLQHAQSDSSTIRCAASTFIRRELTAAAASSYASTSSLGENDEGDRDSDVMSCLEAGSVAERFSTVSLPMNMSSSMEKDDFAGRGPAATKRARSDGRQLLLGKHYQRARRVSEGHSATEATAVAAPTVDKRKSVHTIAEKLSRIRKKRDAMQERLVQYISDRESHLQNLHYLQSIRRVVARPPAAPADTHIYANSPIPQIEKQNRKAFSMLTLLHNSRQNSEDTTSSFGASGLLNAEGLSENMSGHRLQLLFDQAVAEGSDKRDESGKEAETHSDQTDLPRESHRPRSTSESSTNSSSSCGSSSHRIRSRLPSQERHISEAEQFVYSMLAPTALDTATAEQGTAPTSRPELPGEKNKGLWSLSISQQVGPPPQPLMREYERCVRHCWSILMYNEFLW